MRCTVRRPRTPRRRAATATSRTGVPRSRRAAAMAGAGVPSVGWRTASPGPARDATARATSPGAYVRSARSGANPERASAARVPAPTATTRRPARTRTSRPPRRSAATVSRTAAPPVKSTVPPGGTRSRASTTPAAPGAGSTVIRGKDTTDAPRRSRVRPIRDGWARARARSTVFPSRRLRGRSPRTSRSATTSPTTTSAGPVTSPTRSASASRGALTTRCRGSVPHSTSAAGVSPRRPWRMRASATSASRLEPM